MTEWSDEDLAIIVHTYWRIYQYDEMDREDWGKEQVARLVEEDFRDRMRSSVLTKIDQVSRVLSARGAACLHDFGMYANVAPGKQLASRLHRLMSRYAFSGLHKEPQPAEVHTTSGPHGDPRKDKSGPTASIGAIWKLIAHHEDRSAAIRWQLANGRIAVGWGRTGDLRGACFVNSRTIAAAIKDAYPAIKNAGTGGPSLWNFVHEMREGDLVIIVGDRGRSHVVEVVGPYVWVSERDSQGDYMHQRAAVPTEHDPEKLWSLVGGKVAAGQSPHLTVARCSIVAEATDPAPLAYMEGHRVEVVVSRVERNPRARSACLAHYGRACVVCGMEFARRYGPVFTSGIHVHHLRPLADADSPREVDPIEDLRPLCPNCHGAVHQRTPPYTPDDLRALLDRRAEK